MFATDRKSQDSLDIHFISESVVRLASFTAVKWAKRLQLACESGIARFGMMGTPSEPVEHRLRVQASDAKANSSNFHRDGPSGLCLSRGTLSQPAR